MPTVADVVAQAIYDAGSDVVFGLPGGENVQVLDALRRRGLPFVLAHHESAAVFMADATARLTGKPGVCLTTLGPGAANAVAGVAHAWLDRAPVLVITAQMPDTRGPDYTHQMLDLHALFAPITKGSFRLRPQGTRQVVQQALALTTQGRPGPVHLQLSNEDAAALVEGDAAAWPVPRMADADPNDVAQARAVLAQARRPAIVVGLGMEPEGPYDALRALAEALHAPVIVSPKAKGSIPADHPLAGGVIGLTPRDPAYRILDDADCLIGVGFDVVELVKKWDYAQPFIWIANWANADPTLPAVAGCVGRMEPVLRRLAEGTAPAADGWGAARVAAHRADLARRPLPQPAPGRLLPQTALNILHQYLPRDAFFASDVGSHKILSGLEWPARHPNRFMVSNGLSCMGSALPAAIAASRVLTGQPVVCLTGDGGLLMALGELALLARLQTPVMVVVLNDGALDLIRAQQIRAGKPVFGTEFSNPDFVALARAFQMDGYRASDENCLADALSAALAARCPALVEVMIDPTSYPTSPWAVARQG